MSLTPSHVVARPGWGAQARPWAGLTARFGLAIVWAWAALSKLPDPDASVRSVRAFRILPEALAVPVGFGLPVLELALAVLLALGLFTRLSGVLTAVLMGLFIIGISAAWARGLSIDCGCFGGGGEVDPSQTSYLTEIARDLVIAAAASYLVWRPHTQWSLDGRLGLTHEPAVHRDPDQVAADRAPHLSKGPS